MTEAVPGRRPVITDVARQAGVSHQTVSRVLNGHHSLRPETRQRVLDAMSELGYRRNASARALVTRRSRAIGVVQTGAQLYGPASTLLGIEEAARAAGYALTPTMLGEPTAAGMSEALEHLMDRGVDAVVLVTSQTSAVAAAQGLAPRVPVICVGAPATGVVAVSVDNVAGARAATAHLIAQGHRSVAHLAGPPDWVEARARVQGWREALQGAGLPVGAHATGDWSARSGYALAGDLLSAGGTTAVFAANDPMALGLTLALHERGLRVPDDVAVVGYDDIPEAEFFTPPLTTVRQDFGELGRRLVATVLLVLEGRVPGDAEVVVVPQLVVRRSSVRSGRSAPTAKRKGP